jgi:asparagine synthase (glutamine-hydrolysing)
LPEERVIGATGGLLEKFGSGRSSVLANKIRQAQKFSRLSKLNAQQVYKELSRFASEEELAEILILQPDEIVFGPFQPGRELEDYLLQDQSFILPGDMLVKTDRMGMAHGLEVRTPFLDHHLVEWARNQSHETLINKNQGKLCLREVFGHLLPESILSRPKRGFEIPLEKWIPGVWRTEVEHSLRSENIKSIGICKPQGVQTLLEETMLGKGNVDLVWSIFILHNWLENHYSSSPSNLSNALSDS